MSEKKEEKEYTADEYHRMLHDDYDWVSQPLWNHEPPIVANKPPGGEDLFDYYKAYLPYEGGKDVE